MQSLKEALQVLYKTPTTDIHNAVYKRQAEIISTNQESAIETFKKNNPNIKVKLKGPSIDEGDTDNESIDSTDPNNVEEAVNCVLNSGIKNTASTPDFLDAIRGLEQTMRQDIQTKSLNHTEKDWLQKQQPEIAQIALGIKGLSVAEVAPPSRFKANSNARSEKIRETWQKIPPTKASEGIYSKTDEYTRRNFLSLLNNIPVNTYQKSTSEVKNTSKYQNNKSNLPKKASPEAIKKKNETLTSKKFDFINTKLLQMRGMQQQEAIKEMRAVELEEEAFSPKQTAQELLETAQKDVRDELQSMFSTPLSGLSEADTSLQALAIKVDLICTKQENRRFADYRSGGVRKSQEIANQFKDLVEKAKTDEQKQAIVNTFLDAEKLDTRNDIKSACTAAEKKMLEVQTHQEGEHPDTNTSRNDGNTPGRLIFVDSIVNSEKNAEALNDLRDAGNALKSIRQNTRNHDMLEDMGESSRAQEEDTKKIIRSIRGNNEESHDDKNNDTDQSKLNNS